MANIMDYLDDDGKPVGIDVELAEAVCEQLGYTPVFQYIVWDKKDEYLDNGKVDCLWGSFTMNGREDEYQWAGPYLYSRQVIAVRTDSKIRNISDLAGKILQASDLLTKQVSKVAICLQYLMLPTNMQLHSF